MSNGEQQPEPKETAVTIPSDHEITTTRMFDASPERVFDAFTSPELIPRWWGVGDVETIVDEIDLRPGGRWRYIECRPDGSRLEVGGKYVEVDRPKHLCFTFEREAIEGNVAVNNVRFEDIAGRARVTITSRFETTEERDEMLGGMRTAFDVEYAALDRVLAEDEPRSS